MARGACFVGLAGAVLCATPLLAQQHGEPSASGDREIVVTGDADQPFPPAGDVTRQARDITVGTSLHASPLPMFGAPLCPGVFGLSEDYAATIVVRIRENAERFNLAMTDDDGTCSPNFVVAIVDDGQAALKEIADERSRLFRGMSIPARRRLLAEDGPARAWTATEIRTADGVPVSVDPATGVQEARQWSAGSRISLPIREDIVWVLVLIDRDAIPGKTLRQLADYATMRGLARTRPVEADGRPLETILALFDPSTEPPLALTAFDSAYIGAVYRSAANMPAMSKVVAVNREMRRQAQVQAAADGE